MWTSPESANTALSLTTRLTARWTESVRPLLKLQRRMDRYGAVCAAGSTTAAFATMAALVQPWTGLIAGAFGLVTLAGGVLAGFAGHSYRTDQSFRDARTNRDDLFQNDLAREARIAAAKLGQINQKVAVPAMHEALAIHYAHIAVINTQNAQRAILGADHKGNVRAQWWCIGAAGLALAATAAVLAMKGMALSDHHLLCGGVILLCAGIWLLVRRSAETIYRKVDEQLQPPKDVTLAATDPAPGLEQWLEIVTDDAGIGGCCCPLLNRRSSVGRCGSLRGGG